MKKSTKLLLGLTAVSASMATYIYIKNKEKAPIATYTEDFSDELSETVSEDIYDDVKDGQLSFSDEELNIEN